MNMDCNLQKIIKLITSKKKKKKKICKAFQFCNIEYKKRNVQRMKREYISGKNYLYKLLYPLLCQTNQNHRNT